MSLAATLDRLAPPPAVTPARSNALRIGVLDIETYPALTWQWSLWDKFTPVERIVREGGLLTAAFKWYGEDHTNTVSLWEHGQQGMAEALHQFMTDADALVTYNGDRFDLPKLRTYVEVDSGLGPVAPFHSIDLFHTVKRVGGGMLSKKLGYVTERLGIGAKVATGGFDLWVGAMPTDLGGRGDPECQARMLEYNVGDVADTLEPLYDALLPWIKGHPHVGLYDDSVAGNVCQRCQSNDLARKGVAYTPLGAFRRYQCGGCRSWHRGKTRLAGVDVRSV